MAQKIREQPSRKQRLVHIFGWAAETALSVFLLVTRPHTTELLGGLGVLVGVMQLFREINCLLQEPE